MAHYVITAARRGEDGEVTEALCARVLSIGERVEHGKLIPTPAHELVSLIHSGDDVHMLFGDKLGPTVTTKVLGGGIETIQDKVLPHEGVSLKDLPDF